MYYVSRHGKSPRCTSPKAFRFPSSYCRRLRKISNSPRGSSPRTRTLITEPCSRLWRLTYLLDSRFPVVWGKVSNLIFCLMLVYTLDWESHSFTNSWIYYTSFLLFAVFYAGKTGHWLFGMDAICALSVEEISLSDGDVDVELKCYCAEGRKMGMIMMKLFFTISLSVSQSINSTRFTYPLPFPISFFVYITLFPFLRTSKSPFPPIRRICHHIPGALPPSNERANDDPFRDLTPSRIANANTRNTTKYDQIVHLVLHEKYLPRSAYM